MLHGAQGFGTAPGRDEKSNSQRPARHCWQAGNRNPPTYAAGHGPLGWAHRGHRNRTIASSPQSLMRGELWCQQPRKRKGSDITCTQQHARTQSQWCSGTGGCCCNTRSWHIRRVAAALQGCRKRHNASLHLQQCSGEHDMQQLGGGVSQRQRHGGRLPPYPLQGGHRARQRASFKLRAPGKAGQSYASYVHGLCRAQHGRVTRVRRPGTALCVAVVCAVMQSGEVSLTRGREAPLPPLRTLTAGHPGRRRDQCTPTTPARAPARGPVRTSLSGCFGRGQLTRSMPHLHRLQHSTSH